MVDLIAAAKAEVEDTVSEEPVLKILQAIYTGAEVKLQSSKTGHIEAEGRGPVPLSDLTKCLWEDVDHIDRFIEKSNHLEPPTNRVVRIVAAQCDSISGQSFLTIGTKDFRLVFDDIDAWFVQTCADIISEMWHKRLLAEVMLAKEKFLRGFSHQLRTPVHGILGSVELLAEELKSRDLEHTASQAIALLTATATATTRTGDEPIIYLETIKRAGRDLISIINSMITLNRWADIATTERHYATHTLYDLENELWDEARKSISGDSRCASIVFAHHLPPDQCSIRTDLGLLRDSLLPLVINALQNTPVGSVVIDISARASTKELIIDVKDEGRGIPAQDRQRIFELYEQVDVYATGAGIGLTLASKFAALLQGSVELVSSEIDRGSHFRATFQGVDLVYSEPSSEDGSAFSQLTNIPKRFHNIASNLGTSSLCDQFAKFLTCYDFSSSENIEDSLVIIDSVADREQHHAALSRLSPAQAVICLVPYSEGEHLTESGFKNVIYVDGPFLTSTMSYALEQADRFLASTKASRADSVQSTKDITVDSEINESANRDRIAHDANRVGGSNDIVDGPCGDETSPPVGVTSTSGISDALGTLKTLISNMVEPEATPKATQSMIDPLLLSNQQIPRRPAEFSPPNVRSNATSPAVKEPEAAPLLDLQSSRIIPIFPSPATTSRPTSLLVDDNAINLRIMRMYCEKRSLPYICARDGLEAVSLFRSHQISTNTDKTKSPIQLIFMDLQMPNCDGIEASRRIRQIEKENDWRESTLFVVTGQDSPTDRRAVANVGGQEYYVKPFSMKSLDAGLRKYFPLFKAVV
jgi:signal transduction histidine kinase/CheY-like chemotaxis protein